LLPASRSNVIALHHRSAATSFLLRVHAYGRGDLASGCRNVVIDRSDDSVLCEGYEGIEWFGGFYHHPFRSGETLSGDLAHVAIQRGRLPISAIRYRLMPISIHQRCRLL